MRVQPLSRQVMWRAVAASDRRYDGRFFTGVRTTGIYCRPSCTCRKPKPEHVEFYRTAGEAVRAGYRACKRCRPELPGGPAEADRMLVARALRTMGERRNDPVTLGTLARALALSPSRFSRRFRAADGRTPMRALADLRAERAREILERGAPRALDAGLDAGFGSASAFVRAFRRRFGVSPGAWMARHRRRKGGDRT